MVRFHIQQDSDIPASSQLYNQIRFAIASRQFPPGHKLPSTRQLAMQTGLHRNTISKVYRQLEEAGVVEALAGSGIYVQAQGQEPRQGTRLHKQFPDAHQVVRSSIDGLIKQGCSLTEIRDLFTAEIDWRLRCSARVLVTSPAQDIGVAELMAAELNQELNLPIQVVPLEELESVLSETKSGTVVTTHYFINDAEAIAQPHAVRTLSVDIYDYSQEIRLISTLKPGSCVGMVSLSPGLLRGAEVIFHSLRGEEILIMTTTPEDRYKLEAIARSAGTILCDQASLDPLRKAIARVEDELIRLPKVICSENYISATSLDHLKRELGLR
jgi:GntR family transcriptional regulator